MNKKSANSDKLGIWIFVPQWSSVTSQAGFSQHGTSNLMVMLWKTLLGLFVWKSVTMQQVKKHYCWFQLLLKLQAASSKPGIKERFLQFWNKRNKMASLVRLSCIVNLSMVPSEAARETCRDLAGDIINIIVRWTRPLLHVKKRLMN